MNTVILVSALCLAACLQGASAGGYGKNRHLKKTTPLADRFYNHRVAPSLTLEQMPAAFDWGDVNGISYLSPSWNQHIPQYCGSCFLHGTLSMIQDRISVKSKGKSRVMLGRQTFLNCAPAKNLSEGCNGGDIIDVVKYMTEFGLPDESCMPYQAMDFNSLGEPPLASGLTKEEYHCPAATKCINCMPKGDDSSHCWQVSTPVMYRLHAYGQLEDVGQEKRVAGMMSEILHHGPITCSVTSNDEFVYGYNGSIWNETTDKDVDHDVEVVGWGEENGVKFWNVRNSWGTYWGRLGFFRLERGDNANQVEAGDCWYADPDFDMELEVTGGDLIGSMDGLKPKPHTDDDDLKIDWSDDLVAKPHSDDDDVTKMALKTESIQLHLRWEVTRGDLTGSMDGHKPNSEDNDVSEMTLVTVSIS
eukprot:gene17757-24119_t